MSCDACEAAINGGNTEIFYRWKNAAILFVACSEHAKDIFQVLNAAQAKEVIKPAQPESASTPATESESSDSTLHDDHKS